MEVFYWAIAFILAVPLPLILIQRNEDKKAKAREQELKAREQELKALEVKINNTLFEISIKHQDALYKKYKQTVTKDDYGNIKTDKWDKEVSYFIDNVITKDAELVSNLQVYCTANDASWYQLIRLAIDKFTAEYVAKKEVDNGHLQIDIDSLDPIAFEHFCADILKANGWSAKVTQASGDQGIDVIGIYNGKKVVFQCKKYSSPVGNKAVQEASAGKNFEGADIAAVVSNQTYTPSAKELAAKIDVYLLHYSELESFGERLK